jgi:hypothetical protein
MDPIKPLRQAHAFPAVRWTEHAENFIASKDQYRIYRPPALPVLTSRLGQSRDRANFIFFQGLPEGAKGEYGTGEFLGDSTHSFEVSLFEFAERFAFAENSPFDHLSEHGFLPQGTEVCFYRGLSSAPRCKA